MKPRTSGRKRTGSEASTKKKPVSKAKRVKAEEQDHAEFPQHPVKQEPAAAPEDWSHAGTDLQRPKEEELTAVLLSKPKSKGMSLVTFDWMHHFLTSHKASNHSANSATANQRAVTLKLPTSYPVTYRKYVCRDNEDIDWLEPHSEGIMGAIEIHPNCFTGVYEVSGDFSIFW